MISWKENKRAGMAVSDTERNLTCNKQHQWPLICPQDETKEAPLHSLCKAEDP